MRSGDFEYDIYDDEAAITSYCGCNEVIKIPKEIDGKDVTSLENFCFSHTKIKEIYIPGSVRRIRYACFMDSFVNKIVLNDGLEFIGDQCFYSCLNLTELVIPKSIKTLGEYCFGNCFDLHKVVLNNGIEEIKRGCFDHCGIKDLVVPDSVRRLRRACFYGCDKLERIVLGAGVNTIEDGCFCDCFNLRDIEGIERFGRLEVYNAFSWRRSFATVTFPLFSI